MADLIISSRMQRFQLLEGQVACSDRGARVQVDLDGLPGYTGLEAMAQLAALHVRCTVAFERHAFLLKVIRCQWPHQEPLTGWFRLSADLCGHSSSAFAYTTAARGPDGMTLAADLLIGTRPYDREFQKDLLKAHYQGLFDRLHRPTDENNHWLP